MKKNNKKASSLKKVLVSVLKDESHDWKRFIAMSLLKFNNYEELEILKTVDTHRKVPVDFEVHKRGLFFYNVNTNVIESYVVKFKDCYLYAEIINTGTTKKPKQSFENTMIQKNEFNKKIKVLKAKFPTDPTLELVCRFYSSLKAVPLTYSEAVSLKEIKLNS